MRGRFDRVSDFIASENQTKFQGIMARTVIRTRGTTITDEERQIIIDTRNYTREIQKRIHNDMSEIWGTRRRQRLRRINDFDKICRWIGLQTKHRKLRRVNRRIRKLYRWLNTRRIIIVVRPGSHRFFNGCPSRRGYSRGPRFISPVIRFHINKDSFFGSTQNLAKRGGLFIHEMCHEMGMLHGAEDNNQFAEIVANAADPNEKERVIRNPLTYQGLFLEYAGEPPV